MPAIIGVAWVIYGAVSAALFVFSIFFTRYYQSRHESELLATLVTIVALGLIFSTLALLPVDIFLVSSTVNNQTGLKYDWATPEMISRITMTVQLVYYSCFSLVGLVCFFVIPFAYFYYEEDEEDETIQERIMGALKYTSFFVVISVLLFLFGLFLKPTQETPHIDLDWFRKLLAESNGEKAIAFVIACLILLGMVVFIFYTAPGLSLLPLTLIKGRRRIETENEDVDNRLIVIRERVRALKAKYFGSTRKIPAHEQREIENLADEESILTRRLRSIQEDRDSKWHMLVKMMRPIEIMIGFILLGMSLVIVISIFLTIVDKISNSVCGSKCGYIINHPQLFNPVNYIFVALAKMFPLDYLFMVSLILYFFLATMSGVINIGLRFLWVTLFKIQKGATAPQGLLFSAVLLLLSLLALNYTITTVVAPEYAHFGSQVYCNHTVAGLRDCSDRLDLILACDITGPTDICTPTISSTLVDRIIINTPFLGMIFYYSQWAFLIVFGLGFIVAFFRRPRNNVDSETVEQIDADVERSLLNRRQPTYTSIHSNLNPSTGSNTTNSTGTT
ncbi:hypothetical protein J3Q64DRAFT_1775937 [Phycomyces blakesleeanus]|uniref:Probable lysosomal cobalamin transporter n=2 Tax=Phycomyces blakesleeanus TaxID=4837 RepID=A0A162TZ88_PHYB8|nr:hypothetical protein PHYBLDRAFT_134545 [Phycomyces blakesleeanus NRRL 1555(-)]OAD72202.1 hypothetical protein PHYBLDRAFT_134545 [Phycomyces blakesleeanus NRRL 1555(-)]|eukprot:XP_018290242.1 hypothetical protein PHYBLDRAFT_134545 [Phycomyces blakesleeanus NRRL 1555(-)]